VSECLLLNANSAIVLLCTNIIIQINKDMHDMKFKKTKLCFKLYGLPNCKPKETYTIDFVQMNKASGSFNVTMRRGTETQVQSFVPTCFQIRGPKRQKW
jgi:hypothetical protein